MVQLTSATHPKFWEELTLANARVSWIVGLLSLIFGVITTLLLMIRMSDKVNEEIWINRWYVVAVAILILMFIPGWVLHRKMKTDQPLKSEQIDFWCYVQMISGGISLYLFSMVGFAERGTIIPFAIFILFINIFYTFDGRIKIFFNLLAFVMLGICLSYFELSFLKKASYFVESLGIFIPAFIISHYQFRLKKENYLQRLQLEKQNETITTNNSQLMMQSLQTQMNPHFIFNTLNTIQHYLVKNDQKSSLNSMAKFAGLIRMIFHFSNKQSISLENEIKFLQLYLDLEELRFEDKVKINFEISEELESANKNYAIPPLIIQPIIENAFKHSLMYLESGGHLQVKLYKTASGNLGVDVENNGPNWGEEPRSSFLDDDKGAGKALELIGERLAVYDKLNALEASSSLEILPAVTYKSGSLIRVEMAFARN